MVELLHNHFCVIGDPIGHSLSPDIHAKVFALQGLDYTYEKVHVTNENLSDFVEDSRRLARPGFNVTIPHKENIIPFLDQIDPFAKRIGAVNTVWNREGTFIGYNTDVHGCRVALEQSGWSASHTNSDSVILIGAGGAARAVLAALHSMGNKSVLLFDIDSKKANHLANTYADLQTMTITVADSFEAIYETMETSTLLINTSPVGMWPHTDRTPVENWHRIHPKMHVFDLVPKPVNTRLLQQAKQQGAQIIPGLFMLVAQALAADEIWFQSHLPASVFPNVMAYMLDLTERD